MVRAVKPVSAATWLIRSSRGVEGSVTHPSYQNVYVHVNVMPLLCPPVIRHLFASRKGADAPRPEVDEQSAGDEDPVDRRHPVLSDEPIDQGRPRKEQEPEQEPDRSAEERCPRGRIVHPADEQREPGQDRTEDPHQHLIDLPLAAHTAVATSVDRGEAAWKTADGHRRMSMPRRDRCRWRCDRRRSIVMTSSTQTGDRSTCSSSHSFRWPSPSRSWSASRSRSTERASRRPAR